MENYLPLFPLNIVAFPNEALNLHIFEPRYKQLIHDVLERETTFGIPSFVHKNFEYGTEMKILSIDGRYDDGTLDIKTLGSRIFKIIEFKNPWPDKLYAGGIVTYFNSNDVSNNKLQDEIKHLLIELYKALLIEDVVIPEDIKSFEIAHKIGLSLEQEYELIKLADEKERQHFILEHLKQAVPMIQNIEQTRKRIKLNGHFKTFDPLNF